MQLIILLILAIAPCLAIGLFIYLKNPKNTESKTLIFKSVLMGVLSFFLALGIGLLLEKFTNVEEGSMLQQAIRAVIFVGLVEEGSKFLFLRGIVFYNPYFSQPFDGIVYAIMIGMGFAMAENLLYVYLGQGGSLIVRMLTAVPAHASFAVIMGYLIFEAKVFESSRMLFSSMALLFPALAHGYYDYFLLDASIPGLWWQSAVPLIVVIGITIEAIRKREKDDDID